MFRVILLAIAILAFSQAQSGDQCIADPIASSYHGPKICNSLIIGYYYNVTNETCEEIYVPCYATHSDNLYNTEDLCVTSCNGSQRFFPENLTFLGTSLSSNNNMNTSSVCTQPVILGYKNAPFDCEIIRFAYTYNMTNKSCQSITIGGCNNILSGNVFSSMEECQ